MTDINKIFFVITRNPETGKGYLSYKEFFLLARLSGFQVIQKEQVDINSDNIYIISYHDEPVEYRNPDRKCKTIFWNLERGGCPEGYDEVWMSDRSQVQFCCPKARYVPVGGVKDIYPYLDQEKIYDFAYMSNQGTNGRRQVEYDKLVSMGYTLAPAPYEDIKYHFLAQSRVGLCLHQSNDFFIEPIRYAIFSSFGLPLLCEHSNDFYPYTVYSYEDFLQNPDISKLTQNNYELMTGELSFYNCIMTALNA